MEHVRPAATADLDRCLELLTDARLAAARTRGGREFLALGIPAGDPIDVAEPRHLLERWVNGPLATVLVGEYHGEVVGLAAGTVHDGSTAVGRIECCYVEDEAREVGVGSALVEALLGWFADQGCSDVDAVALPGDRHTKQLFETAGFKARLLVLHRPLA